jgi:hypothetical protein
VNRLVINLWLIGAFCIGFYIAFNVFNLPIMLAMYGGAGLALCPVVIAVLFSRK